MSRIRVFRLAQAVATVLAFSVIAAVLPSAARAGGLDLSAYKGKVVYLDFWASWCAPCLESFPWMNELANNYGHDGLVVIAVNLDHSRALATKFLAQHPAAFKVVYDPSGSLAEKYNVQAMPTSFLIGRNGKIADVHSGFYPKKEREYLASINSLLRRKAP